MKRLIAIATVMVFVFAVSSVYACGEKSSSAKASKASYGSECGSKATKASTTESNSDKVEATTANYKAETVGTKAYCSKKSDDSKASVMNADANGGCHWKGDNTKASVMKADARAGKVNCPASADCPTPCNKDTQNIKTDDQDVKVNKMKAENSREEIQPTQASTESKSEVLSQ
jgi:hypothetical protein